LEPQPADIALLKQWAAYKADPANADNRGADESYPWAGSSIWNDAAQYLNDKFGEIYGQCPGPTVVKGIVASGVVLDSATEDVVGSSVGEKEFLGIFFSNTTRWSASGDASYPYQAVAELWRRGFIPSFDGTTWRLSSGPEGTIVYTLAADQVTNNSQEAANAPIGVWLIAAALVCLLGLAVLLLIRTKTRKRSA
jgi:hypothetical protein